MNDYYQFRDETGTPIDYYQLVYDNNNLCKEVKKLEQENKQLKEELKNKSNVLEITRYLDIIRTYLKEIDRLQQKIDKALKYIDEFTGYYADDDGTPMFVIEELKEETFVKDIKKILGDEKDE